MNLLIADNLRQSIVCICQLLLCEVSFETDAAEGKRFAGPNFAAAQGGFGIEQGCKTESIGKTQQNRQKITRSIQ